MYCFSGRVCPASPGHRPFFSLSFSLSTNSEVGTEHELGTSSPSWVDIYYHKMRYFTVKLNSVFHCVRGPSLCLVSDSEPDQNRARARAPPSPASPPPPSRDELAADAHQTCREGTRGHPLKLLGVSCAGAGSNSTCCPECICIVLFETLWQHF